MRFVSWNVNGLRAVMKKGFPAVFDELNGRILRTDERALDLALQLIQVMTDEQPAEYKLEPMASLFQE